MAIAARAWTAALVLIPVLAPALAGASAGRRWRIADLSACEELRSHELARRWIWQPGPTRPAGERVYLRGQGELIREWPWPAAVEYVSMTARREQGPRLPLGAGQHVVMFGATGAGKTTTARRLIAARPLAQNAALFVLDQKGDDEDVEQMQLVAAAADVPFILFDSQDPGTAGGSRCGGPPTGSPPAAWNRSANPSRTTTTRYAGTWTSCARSCTPPTAGPHPFRS